MQSLQYYFQVHVNIFHSKTKEMDTQLIKITGKWCTINRTALLKLWYLYQVFPSCQLQTDLIASAYIIYLCMEIQRYKYMASRAPACSICYSSGCHQLETSLKGALLNSQQGNQNRILFLRQQGQRDLSALTLLTSNIVQIQETPLLHPAALSSAMKAWESFGNKNNETTSFPPWNTAI